MASLLSTTFDGMENQEFIQLFSQYVPGPGEDWDLVSLAIDAAIDGMGTLPSEQDPPQPLPEPSPPPNGRSDKNSFSGTKDQNEDDDEDDDDDGDEDDEEDQAAVKRLRHREAMQRCRQRKRSRMGALEKQQKQLKALLRARLVEHQQREQLAAMRTSPPPPPAPLVADSFGLLPLNSMEELRKLFARAVSLKEALMDERKDLEKSLRDHQKFERLVMLSTNQIVNEPKEPSAFHQPTQPLANDTSDSMEDDASSSGQDSSAAGSTTSSRQARPTGHWVEYLDNEDPLFYEPEPVEAIDEHIRECYQRVRRLKDSFDTNLLGISIKKTVCLGWTAEHAQLRLDDQRFELRFRFRRRVSVQRKSLDELQKATWNLMKDPVMNARLYSALVVCKVVQWVGENTFIFIRNAPDKDKRLHIRYFSMHSQMEYRTDNNERSYVTLMKILEKDPHILQSTEGKAPALPVVWLKHGTLFLNFTEKPDTQEIEIEYGGSVHCMSDEQAQYLLIEIGGMLMRWEHMIIPQNLLTF